MSQTARAYVGNTVPAFQGDPGAYDRLAKIDTRLREVVQKVIDALGPLLPPAAPMVACSAPTLACPEPMRTPIGQLIHELDLAIDRLEGTINRIDL